jgi:hypothetical protein
MKKLTRDQKIVLIRIGKTILNHRMKARLGVTANNGNDDSNNDEIRKSD